VIAFLAIFSAAWFATFVGSALARIPDRWTTDAVGWGIVAVVVALMPAMFVARIPHKVTVYEDGTCAFRSLIGMRIVRAQQILSVSADNEGGVDLRYEGGRVSMYRLKDFEAFVAQLLELNPAISLPRGWRAELRAAARARRWDGN
jgi:hypothetical protein